MIRGVDSRQEQTARQLARDTRPLGVRIAEGISKPLTVILICTTAIITSFIYPLITDVAALLCIAVFIFAITRPTTLPFRIPKTANMKDYNDPIPGSKKPKMGEGISYFGNDRLTREELWFSNDDLRTHVLIFGSTGSGKTEYLLSLAFNSLVQASGFIYIDGKGDNSLYAKIFSMSRTMGREDDVLLINFMTGARDVLGPQKTRLSNTMNPFARGSSSMLSQLVVSLMSSGKQQGASGNDDMWTNRAINFVESLMKILVVMRDAGHILLDANTIREYFILEKLEQIVIDKRFPIDDTHSVPLDAYPKQILEPLIAYMNNLPGYNRQKKGNQSSEVREQHGFITMQLTRTFGSLADTYGHIIRTNLAEVDFKDVVLNRRIMVVLLPALEKSPQELSNLGKVIVASLKAMMAAGLGEEVEGDYRDVVLRKPTNSPAPFTCIMDEYGYYAVEGFAVVPAQARSLGFSAIFAGQDLPAFQKASKEEAASIGANCNVKICMKLEDPQETWEYFNKVAGESYTTNVSGFQMDAGSLTMNYMDTRSASIDKRQRIDLLDLKDQRPGECHIFWKSKIIRADSFYAAAKPAKKMRLNHFLKVEPPPEHVLVDMDKRLKRFKQVFSTPNYEMPPVFESEDIKTVTAALQGAINLKPFERGISALITVLEQEVQRQRDLSVPYEAPGVENEMSAFTKIFPTPLVIRMIGEENQDLFSLPLIRRGSTTEEMKHIQRLSGNSEAEAIKAATSIISDIENATRFPPEVEFESDEGQMLEDINDLIGFFGGAKLDLESLKQEATQRTDSSLGFDGSEFELPEFPEIADFSELEDLEEESEFEEESSASERDQEGDTSIEESDSQKVFSADDFAKYLEELEQDQQTIEGEAETEETEETEGESEFESESESESDTEVEGETDQDIGGDEEGETEFETGGRGEEIEEGELEQAQTVVEHELEEEPQITEKTSEDKLSEIEQAEMQGEIEEEIIQQLPPDFEKINEEKVSQEKLDEDTSIPPSTKK